MEQFIDLFDKIYYNKADTTDQKLFLGRLETDKQFAEEYKKYVLAVDLINLHQNAQYINAVHHKYVNGKYNKSSIIGSILRIAASVVLLSMVSFSYWLYISTGSSVLENTNLSYIESTTRDETTLKAELEILFMQGNSALVLKAYDKLRSPEPKQTFLAAMSHYKLKQYADAHIKLIDLQKINPKEYKYEIEFYLGQSLVGMNKINEALQHFEKMSPSNPYFKNIDWWYRLKLRLLLLKYSKP